MDFRVAWQNHMQAWRKQANLYNTLDSENFEDYSIVKMRGQNGEEIDRTWYEVLRIARTHGAVIPNGAY